MAKTIREAIESDLKGFYIGRRLALPFKCQVIKIIAGGENLTVMERSGSICIGQDPQNTSIYFLLSGKLKDYVGNYKVIKLIVCEYDDDVCIMDNHVKLVCEMKDNHLVNIQVPSDDMLFIE
ncbi:hypothetical protein JYT51_01250 [Candidatus Amoebophilus asiaticus]|nr:hypothetical protein [Candidatus Amoebophilus asiaticus]